MKVLAWLLLVLVFVLSIMRLDAAIWALVALCAVGSVAY